MKKNPLVTVALIDPFDKDNNYDYEDNGRNFSLIYLLIFSLTTKRASKNSYFVWNLSSKFYTNKPKYKNESNVQHNLNMSIIYS